MTLSVANGLSLPENSSVTGAVVYTPTDPLGLTDMTSELEALALAYPDRAIEIKSGSIIYLKDFFRNIKQSLHLYGKNVTVVYPNTCAVGGIVFDMASEASSPREVTALTKQNAKGTTNDSYITRLECNRKTDTDTIFTRFDWLAIESTIANEAMSGGYLGEIAQVLYTSELEGTDKFGCDLVRILNRHDQLSSGLSATGSGVNGITSNIRARRLDKSKTLKLEGIKFRPFGNSQATATTTRCPAVTVIGAVNPQIFNCDVFSAWQVGFRFYSCAMPEVRDSSFRDTANLATYNGFTYGVQFYGMNDAGTITNSLSVNGRHAIFTTDGNSSSTTTWWQRGIPTNCVIDGFKAFYGHGSPIDTHEEGDNIVIQNGTIMHSVQDSTISPNFRSTGIQLRAANCTLQDIVIIGGSRGIKFNAIDHGFKDRCLIKNVTIQDTVYASEATAETGIWTDDQSALSNKRELLLENITFRNVGDSLTLNKGVVCRARGSLIFDRCYKGVDHYEGSEFYCDAQQVYDYHNIARTPNTSACILRGASTVSYVLRRPIVYKNNKAAEPTNFYANNDANAKTVFIEGIIEFNLNLVTSINLFDDTTGITRPDISPMRLSNLADVILGSPLDATTYGLQYASETGKYTAIAIPSASNAWTEAIAQTTNNGSGVLGTTTLATIPVSDNKASYIDIQVLGSNAARSEACINAGSSMCRRNSGSAVTIVNTGLTQSSDDITGTVTISRTVSSGNILVTVAITGGTASAVIDWLVRYRVREL